MRDKLPVDIENNELPVDIYSESKKRDNSYGYVSILSLISIIITLASVITVIMFGK